jgi:putative aminopeptidase FrvX
VPRLKIDTDYLGARLAELLAIPSPTGYTDNVVRACSAS